MFNVVCALVKFVVAVVTAEFDVVKAVEKLVRYVYAEV